MKKIFLFLVLFVYLVRSDMCSTSQVLKSLLLLMKQKKIKKKSVANVNVATHRKIQLALLTQLVIKRVFFFFQFEHNKYNKGYTDNTYSCSCYLPCENMYSICMYKNMNSCVNNPDYNNGFDYSTIIWIIVGVFAFISIVASIFRWCKHHNRKKK